MRATLPQAAVQIDRQNPNQVDIDSGIFISACCSFIHSLFISY